MTDPRNITDPMLERMAKLSIRPFEPPMSILGRALTALEEKQNPSPATLVDLSPRRPGNQYKRFDVASPPPLRFSKMLGADIQSLRFTGSWSSLLVRVMHSARSLATTDEQFVSTLRAARLNVTVEMKSDKGFTFHPDLGVSLQGVDSNLSAAASFHLAKTFGFPLTIMWQWEDREEAHKPGVWACMEFVPPKSVAAA